MNKELLDFLITSLQNNKPSVLLTVATSSGHAPGREGFAMAVTKDELSGTIGGGAIEKSMVTIARKFIKEEKTTPEIFYRVHNIKDKKNSSGMICGGTQTVILHLIKKSHSATLKQCLESYQSNGTPNILRLSPFTVECLGGKRAETYSFRNLSDGQWQYEEVIGQKDIAFIFGGGHVSLALSPILASLGFRIVVLDERPFINTIQKNKFCDELFISPFRDLPKMIREGPRSYAFIMTPSHLHDETVLRGLLGKDLKYLGMMASKTKVAEIFEHLEKEGFSKEQLKAIHSPIGLSIKSRTPAEIAVSIAAEVIQVRNS